MRDAAMVRAVGLNPDRRRPDRFKSGAPGLVLVTRGDLRAHSLVPPTRRVHLIHWHRPLGSTDPSAPASSKRRRVRSRRLHLMLRAESRCVATAATIAKRWCFGPDRRVCDAGVCVLVRVSGRLGRRLIETAGGSQLGDAASNGGTRALRLDAVPPYRVFGIVTIRRRHRNPAASREDGGMSMIFHVQPQADGAMQSRSLNPLVEVAGFRSCRHTCHCRSCPSRTDRRARHGTQIWFRNGETAAGQ